MLARCWAVVKDLWSASLLELMRSHTIVCRDRRPVMIGERQDDIPEVGAIIGDRVGATLGTNATAPILRTEAQTDTERKEGMQKV